MSYKIFVETIFKKKYLIFFIILIGVILKLLYLQQLDDYYDDWNFFFTVDPNISNELTWVRYYGDRRILEQYNAYDYQKVGEDFPYYFAFFTKFILNIVGYSVEKVHYLVVSFSILSLFIITKICDLIEQNVDFKILTLLLFVSNLYLIKDLSALRPHSLSILLTLISLYFFILIYFKKQKSLQNIIIYSLLTLCYLLIWPLNLAFFAGKLFVLLLIFTNRSYNDFKIILVPSVIVIFSYLILNHHYLEYQVLNKTEHYTSLNIKFFYSYFFNMFFGSIYFGGIMLILFSFFFINKIHQYLKIFKNKFVFYQSLKIENIFLIIILTIYILIIAYSILRAPVMAAKYVPFLVPILIFWLSYKIFILKNKLIYFSVILFSILNSAIFWNDIQIDRPPIKKVLYEIKKSEINKIFTSESYVFNHYLENYDVSINNNLEFNKFSDFKNNDLPNKFWFICLNNARFIKGQNNLPDEERCFAFKREKNLRLIKTLRMNDILMHVVQKN